MTGDSTNQIQQIMESTVKAVSVLAGARSSSHKKKERKRRRRRKMEERRAGGGWIVFPHGNS